MMMTKPQSLQDQTEARLFELFNLSTLNRHRRLVLGCMAMMALLGVAAAMMRVPTYTASTRILIENRQLQMTNQQDVMVVEEYLDPAQFQNQIEILRSDTLLLRLVQEHRLSAPEAPSLLRSLVGGSTTGEPSQQALWALQKQLVVARVGSSHAIDVIYTTADPVQAANVVNGLVTLYLAWQSERSMESADIASPWLRQRISGMGPNAAVISQAVAPERPDGPGRSRTIALFLVLGGMLGFGLAFLAELRDRSFRSCAELARLTRAECLGIMPTNAGPLTRVTLHRMRRAMGQRKSQGPARIVALGAATLDEDAAPIALNFARLLAEEGSTVLLTLAGEQVGAGGNLSVIRLDDVSQTSLRTRIEDLRTCHAYLVLDLSPLVPGLEMREVADMADDAFLIVGWGSTPRPLVEQALLSLQAESSRLRGVVLAQVDLPRLRFYDADEHRIFTTIISNQAARPAT